LSKSEKDKEDLRIKIKSTPSSKLVDIFCYYLMPSHFHFLVRQTIEGGVSKFMGNFQNSYTKYFNKKNDRDGSLFSDQFKAVLIENDAQLLHVSRYIHLNPFTSGLVKDCSGVFDYPHSSAREYAVGEWESQVCDRSFVLKNFGSIQKYKDFVLNQAGYQKRLATIKHLALE
jgi:putative transposase